MVRDRVQWLRNVKKRLKKLTQVIYWRTGKPLSIIREEVRWREMRELLRLTLYTLHPAPWSTLHPTLYTLHPTPYTLHPAPYTLNPKLQTLNPIL